MGLGVLDVLVLIATFAAPVCVGAYHRFRYKWNKDSEINLLSLAINLLMTNISTVAFLGYQMQMNLYGMQIYIVITFAMVFVPVSIWLFQVVFQNIEEKDNVYSYLDERYDTCHIRWLATVLYIIQTLSITVASLYATALALDLTMGVPVWVSEVLIILIAAACALLEHSIWANIFHYAVFIFGLLYVMCVDFIIAGGIGNLFTAAAENPHLFSFEFTFNPFEKHNAINFFLGYSFIVLTLYGANPWHAILYDNTEKTFSRALLLTIPLKVFTIIIVFFATLSSHIPMPETINSHIYDEDQNYSGVIGFSFSCVCSITISLISSSLLSLAVVTKENIRRMITVPVYAVICIGLAICVQHAKSIFQITKVFVAATSGPLMGIFLSSIFVPFMNTAGNMVGAICGFSSVLILGFKAVDFTNHSSDLTTQDIKDAKNPLNLNYDNQNKSLTMVLKLDVSEHPYALSYFLYPYVGCLVTIIVGIAVSMVLRRFIPQERVNDEHLHKAVRESEFVQHYTENNYEDSSSSTLTCNCINIEKVSVCAIL